MTKYQLIRRTRKWHRYLGLLLGIQFLLWTIGGLYFSWTNINEIRGGHLKKEVAPLPTTANYVTPAAFLRGQLAPADTLVALKLKMILQEPYYEMVYTHKGSPEVKLIHAVSGVLRKPLSREEAVEVAKDKLNTTATITQVEILTTTGKHHEYRGRPLPAFAVTFASPANTTLYVSQQYGNVETFRSNQWRVFDFLWMLHTMGYKERDNFNNTLLRAFSVFGIFTILSGFALFTLTTKRIRFKSNKHHNS